MTRYSVSRALVGNRPVVFILGALFVGSMWLVPATSQAQDAVYEGKLDGKKARLEVHETANGMRGALRIGKAKVNLRGKREGKQFVGHMGPKSANVRFRAKPKGDAMVLTITEGGKKPQTVTLPRMKKKP